MYTSILLASTIGHKIELLSFIWFKADLHKTFKVLYGSKEKVYTPDFYHPEEDRYVETKAVRRDRKFNSNLLAADLLKEQGVNIDVVLMDDFYRQIKQSGHYWLIDNIENKNYDGTRHLIYLKKAV